MTLEKPKSALRAPEFCDFACAASAQGASRLAQRRSLLERGNLYRLGLAKLAWQRPAGRQGAGAAGKAGRNTQVSTERRGCGTGLVPVLWTSGSGGLAVPALTGAAEDGAPRLPSPNSSMVVNTVSTCTVRSTSPSVPAIGRPSN